MNRLPVPFFFVLPWLPVAGDADWGVADAFVVEDVCGVDFKSDMMVNGRKCNCLGTAG